MHSEKRDTDAHGDGRVQDSNQNLARMSLRASTAPRRFDHVEASLDQQRAMNVVRMQFESLEKLIKNFIAPGPYVSLGLTKLEEAHMMLNKAITHEGTI